MSLGPRAECIYQVLINSLLIIQAKSGACSGAGFQPACNFVNCFVIMQRSACESQLPTQSAASMTAFQLKFKDLFKTQNPDWIEPRSTDDTDIARRLYTTCVFIKKNPTETNPADIPNQYPGHVYPHRGEHLPACADFIFFRLFSRSCFSWASHKTISPCPPIVSVILGARPSYDLGITTTIKQQSLASERSTPLITSKQALR